MPKNLTPQDQWETEFEVPLPGEPRNIGPLEILFQRLLNRTERLRSRISDLLGLPWDSTPPDTLAGLHQRVGALEAAQEAAQSGVTIQDHRTASVLDHPDGSVTTEKLADGAVTSAKLAPGALSGIVPYDIAFYRSGRIAGGTVLLRMMASRSITIPTSGHRVTCGVAPTANWQADIQKNGVSVGTISIPLGQTTGNVSIANQISVSEGDILTVVAQAASDASLSGLSVVLRGVV